MNKGTNKALVIIGLIIATLGFGNFLIGNGGLDRIMGHKEIITPSDNDITEAFATPQVLSATETLEETTTNYYLFEATVSGQTAFELLLSNIDEVEYTQYDFGTFVESINTVAGNNEYFWAFYLNDEKAQSGADKTVLEEGDKVEFIYEKIEF